MRSSGLVFQELEAETIVFDPKTNQVHNLNELAALILENCKPGVTRCAVVSLLQKRLGLSTQAAREALEMSLAEMAEAGLIVNLETKTLDRREFLAKWGVAAALVPTLTTLTMPSAAVSASGCDCTVDPSPSIMVNRTCISGTRTHTFDLSGSTHVCEICEYAVDIENDGSFEFSSPTQNIFFFTYTGGLTAGDRTVGFRVQGPCFANGASNIDTTTLTFAIDCP